MPLALRTLGMRRFSWFVVSQAGPQLGRERAGWLAGLMADQDPALMVLAWKESMSFDSRPRLAEIGCPTLIVAAADDRAVPMHHARTLHDGIPGSRLVVVDNAGHALIWTHPDELVRATEEFLTP